MALLIVISLVSVLSAITLQFNRKMREGYIFSGNLGHFTQLTEMARSGIGIAEQLLLADLDDNSFDSLYDSWALLTDEDLSTLFDSGNIELEVQDESGKFQINAVAIQKSTNQTQGTDIETERKKQENHAKAVRNVLWRLLRAEPFVMEDGDAREIIDALIDWTDSGDGEEEYGAEEGYYRSLIPPYSCKNGPIESLEELLLVKGITQELLYGTKEKPGLAPLLTPWGSDGKININTADVLLLQALEWDLTKETAEAMIDFREDENNRDKLNSIQWYKQVPSFPGDIELPEDRAVTISHFFTIKATSTMVTQKKTVQATMERANGKINLLRWDSN